MTNEEISFVSCQVIAARLWELQQHNWTHFRKHWEAASRRHLVAAGFQEISPQCIIIAWVGVIDDNNMTWFREQYILGSSCRFFQEVLALEHIHSGWPSTKNVNIHIWILDANSAVAKNRFPTPKGTTEKKYWVFKQSADNHFNDNRPLSPCLETLVLRRRGM